jgi:hypothetical protein
MHSEVHELAPERFQGGRSGVCGEGEKKNGKKKEVWKNEDRKA